jgi:hypothetical protein
MKRFLTIIAATAVAAAVAIPAVADSGSPSTDGAAAFESCLRAHGIGVPADLEGRAFKEWIGAHPDTPGLDAAFEACGAAGAKSSAAAPEELRACLAGKGLTAPTTIEEFKPWIEQQLNTAAGKQALTACGFGGVEDKHVDERGGPCGGDQPQAKASRVQRPKARVTPTT